jgi:hypothetical protein
MAEWYDQVESTIREHVAAFNAHDLPRLLGGLAQEIIWQIGHDTFLRRGELAGVFSDVLRVIAPTLTILSLLIDRNRAPSELCERMMVEGVERDDWIAGFYRVDALGVFKSVRIYRQGLVDVSWFRGAAPSHVAPARFNLSLNTY